MKLFVALFLSLNIVACGGGGGIGDSATTAGGSSQGPTVNSTFQYDNVGAVMVPGRFTQDRSPHVVVASIRYHFTHAHAYSTAPGPVKILKITANNGLVDVTKSVLGQEIDLFTTTPLVADFNNDGIDDIFFAGWTDTTLSAAGVAFISNATGAHTKIDLLDKVWAHDVTALDINLDGFLDVISNRGDVWINNGHGRFVYREHSYKDVAGLWLNGSGVCAGDFRKSGKPQLVMTDLALDPAKSPVADTALFELDKQGLPVSIQMLPSPILDKQSVTEVSHEVTCRAADLNGDGWLDIIIMSRPWPAAEQSWSNTGSIQILLNRQGKTFDDVTDTAVRDYNTNVHISYVPIVDDFNSDGRPDLWLSSFDWASGKATQVLINNGNMTFSKAFVSVVDNLPASGGILPIKTQNNWSLLYGSMNTGSKTTVFHFAANVLK